MATTFTTTQDGYLNGQFVPKGTQLTSSQMFSWAPSGGSSGSAISQTSSQPTQQTSQPSIQQPAQPQTSYTTIYNKNGQTLSVPISQMSSYLSQGWLSAPYTPPAPTALQEGRAYKMEGNAIYKYENGQLKPIPDEETYRLMFPNDWNITNFVDLTQAMTPEQQQYYGGTSYYQKYIGQPVQSIKADSALMSHYKKLLQERSGLATQAAATGNMSRDLKKEQVAVDKFIQQYNKLPATRADWDKVAAMAYGAGYSVQNGQLVSPPTQIPDSPASPSSLSSAPASAVSSDAGTSKIANTTGTAGTSGTTGAAVATGKVLSEDLTNIDTTDQAFLVRFASDPDASGPYSAKTVFLVDNTNKTIRPFINEEAFNNFMKQIGRDEITIANAETSGYINVASPNLLNQGYALSGYKLLSTEQGIQASGNFMTEENIDTDSLSRTYGYQKNSNAVSLAFRVLDNTSDSGGLLSMLKNDSSSGISPELIDEISKDANIMTMYVNALAYGGYDVPAIIRDIKRRQLVKNGETQFTNVKVIDTTKTASQYYGTAEGQRAINDTNLSVPKYLSSLDTNTLKNLSIFQLPQEAFDVLTPVFDMTSESGKQLMESIDTAYYDVLMQQLEAKTEQEKALADYGWSTFRKELADKYNIQLGDNALAAWDKLQSIRESGTQANIGKSGIYQEMIDKYLQSVRRNNQRLRDEKISTEQKQEIEYLLKYGTAEQIQTFLNNITDPTEKSLLEKYFKPDAETKNYFSLSNLKSLFPNVDEKTLKRYSESLLDPGSGLFRSQIYQQLWENKFGPVTVPTEGVQPAKEAYQLGDVEYDSAGNLIGGSGALFKNALAQQEKEKLYTGGTLDTYSQGTTGNANINVPESTNVPQETYQVPVTENPYAASQAKYTEQTGQTGQTVPGYEPVTQSPAASQTPTPTVSPTPSTTWAPPTGYVRIPDVASMGNYTNIISNPTNQYDIGRWGIPKATSSVAAPAATSPTPTVTSSASQTSTDLMKPFTDWSKGKTDVLGYNWQGYKPITASEYITNEQKKKWKNVQAVGSSLYGYYSG